jgi:hypothetical protein
LAFDSLWLPIGLHFGWNFTEGVVLGAPLSGSGIDLPGLLVAHPSGPELLTGGRFGPEAGLPALLLCLVVAAFLLRDAHRRGRIIRSRRYYRRHPAQLDLPPGTSAMV